MQSLRTILMSGVAAISLAAVPALAQQATDTAPGDRSYDETYGGEFAEWGDRTVDELLGTEVVNDAGETIGDIDNFGLADDQLVAIIGIGGFLGLGEHQVAVPIDQLAAQGDQLVLSGVTREELEAMPEYDEQASQTFAGDQTLRSGYEGGALQGTTETAATQEATTPSDEPMADAQEDVAEAADDAAEGVDEAGEDVAEAVDDAADSVTEESGESPELAEGESAEPTAEETDIAEGEASEPMAEETDVTEGEATEPMAEETDVAEGEATEPMAEETDVAEGEATEPVAEETDVAEGEATEEPAADEAAEVAETDAAEEPTAETEMAETEAETGWTSEMDQIFADIADREISELIGMDVAGADGEVVGQVDNFALEGEEVVAIVGVGGFLGIGEHDVALSLGDMTYDGEKLVLSSMTEDQLRDMPEYESNEANQLPQDQTLRSTYDQ